MSIITSTEFARFFASCKPPTGWSKSITVALSGGPDSVCLLFLLHRHFSTTYPPSPTLRSITVDHALQLTSQASAQRTHARALAMGIPNIVLPAEWDTKPAPGGAVEEAARKARYKALWRGVWKSKHSIDSIDDNNNTQTLMFAHHADDQLETVIMRTMRGTGAYGMGGMRSVRRWGMGEEGLRGMRTWICRPLLGVSKERILATCGAHGLSYEQDVTNFMPDLTVRNAVRHALSRPQDQPTNVHIRGAIERVRALAGGAENIEQMRGYVGKMADRVVHVDKIVDAYLKAHTLPSPPSTLLLVPPASTALTPDAQTALIHRILRYISPHPWGSPQSEANRKSESIHRIIQHVLHPSAPDIKPFAAGAQVLWTPVFLRSDGVIRQKGGDEMQRGWLASRQPPLKGAIETLEVEAQECMLWDNRFLVHVRGWELDKCEKGQHKVIIRPKGRLVLPDVVRVWQNGEEEPVECQFNFIRELDAV